VAVAGTVGPGTLAALVTQGISWTSTQMEVSVAVALPGRVSVHVRTLADGFVRLR